MTNQPETPTDTIITATCGCTINLSEFYPCEDCGKCADCCEGVCHIETPDEIWLQVLDHPDIPWCAENINPSDVGYVKTGSVMTLAGYQKNSRQTANYPSIGHPVIYPMLGLAGEVGEVSEKIKKIFRDKDGHISTEDRQALKKELGDVLWYLTQICTELDLTLDEVAGANLAKLMSRRERGKIQGNGDDR